MSIPLSRNSAKRVNLEIDPTEIECGFETAASSAAQITKHVNHEMTPAGRKSICRQVVVHFQNSCRGLAENPETCTFKALDDNATMHLFGSTTRAPGADGASLSDAGLKDALLISCKVKSVNSEFPYPLKFDINQLAGNRRLASGERTNFLIAAKQRSPEMDTLIAKPSPYLSSSFLTEYPAYNASNLLTCGIMQQPGNTDFMYVSSDHPCIPMIQSNSDTLQCSLDDSQLVDGKFYKIDAKMVTECCNCLKDELQSSLPTIDLTAFSATIGRCYGQSFDDMSTINCKDRETALDAIRNCTVELELTYAI